MKNAIPLVLAVLLGLAAVLAVGRILREREKAAEETCTVVVAARDIMAGEKLTEDAVAKKELPVSNRPREAVYWSRRTLLVGMKAIRAVSSGDYVLYNDIGAGEGVAGIVAAGEWAVTLDVSGVPIAAAIQPGDEVVVIGTVEVEQAVPSADLASAPKEITKTATMVLFPRVRVLDLLGRDADGGGKASQIVLSLPPQEAQTLIAAQEKYRLTLALRKSGDESAMSRLDGGVVDEETFAKMFKGLRSVTMPDVPGGRPEANK